MTPNSPSDPDHRAGSIDSHGLSDEDDSERTALADDAAAVESAVEQLIEESSTPETQPAAIMGYGRLRGRVAIVTGASRGLGRAIALDLAAAGVHIAFNFLDEGSRSRIEAQDTARELRQMEVRVFCRECDLRESEAVDEFVADVQAQLGGLHILVNNAGIGADRAHWRMTDDEWAAVLRTNVDGTFHMMRAVAPVFRRHEFGKIVNIASVHAERATFGVMNYAASKAAVISMTRNAALELGPHNVNVNAVSPGYIRTTRLTDRVPAEVLDRAREHSALERLGDPQDVANVVLFLCSEAARHITGAVIPVDGGYQL
ncbi:MAG TPA: 3-oxoacyl-ACP reductase family protein [Longimicrobiales bacterium]|nr:3-oxoacyl-ACP reductase family protein [Longimicrobiales bacterium]